MPQKQPNFLVNFIIFIINSYQIFNHSYFKIFLSTVVFVLLWCFSEKSFNQLQARVLICNKKGLRIIYMGLNELIKDDCNFVWNIANILILYFMAIWNPFLFSFKLSITQQFSRLYFYKHKWNIFFSFPDYSRI